MIQKLLNRKALTNDQFQRANKAVIEQESNHQKKVTDTVVEIVDKMDGVFQDVLGEMAYINESIDAAHVAMNGIAKVPEICVAKGSFFNCLPGRLSWV